MVFLNVKVHLDVKSGKLSTVSFQKAQNLHSYLPSYSAHSQDCLRGMIFGFVRRYWLQNTNPEDYSYMIKLFAKRLTARGHSLPTVNKIIMEAVSSLEIQMPNRKIFINNNKRSSNTGINENMFYHAEYHPLGVKRELIQKAFKATLNKLGLYNKMTVCYNRPTNLRDLLMSSKLPNVPGCNPSDFLNSFKKWELSSGYISWYVILALIHSRRQKGYIIVLSAILHPSYLHMHITDINWDFSIGSFLNIFQRHTFYTF